MATASDGVTRGRAFTVSEDEAKPTYSPPLEYTSRVRVLGVVLILAVVLQTTTSELGVGDTGMKRSKLLLVVCSVGLAGVLAYLAGAQQSITYTPISLSVTSTGSGGIPHGWILWSNGDVTKVDLPSTIGR